MGSKQQAKSKLAAVLEDLHVDHYNEAVDDVSLQKKLAAAAASSALKKQQQAQKKKKETMSLLRVLGKLRDAYVRMMNDMAEKGDMMTTVGLAGYHGVAAPAYNHYPSTSSGYRPAFQSGSKITTREYNDCAILSELFKADQTSRTQTRSTSTQVITKP